MSSSALSFGVWRSLMENHVRPGVFREASAKFHSWAPNASVQVSKMISSADKGADKDAPFDPCDASHGGDVYALLCKLENVLQFLSEFHYTQGNAMAVIARWVDQFCDLVFEVSYNSILPDKNAPGQRRSDDERAEVPGDVPVEGGVYRSGGGRGAEQLRRCAVGHLVDAIMDGHDPQRGDPESSRGVYSPPISCAGVLANYNRETVQDVSVVRGLADRTGAVSGLMLDGDIGDNDVNSPGLRMYLLKLSRAVHSFAARTFRVEKALRADNTGECDEERLVQLQSAFTCVGFPMVGISRGLRRVADTLKRGRTRIYDIWRLNFSFLDFLISLIDQFGKRADEMCAVLHGGDPAKCGEDAASPACPPPRRNRAPTRRVSVLARAATLRRRAHEPRGRPPSRAHGPSAGSPAGSEGDFPGMFMDSPVEEPRDRGPNDEGSEDIDMHRFTISEEESEEPPGRMNEGAQNVAGSSGEPSRPIVAAESSRRPRAKRPSKENRRYTSLGSMLKNARAAAAFRKEHAALTAALGAASASAASPTGAAQAADLPNENLEGQIPITSVGGAFASGGLDNSEVGNATVADDPSPLSVVNPGIHAERTNTSDTGIDDDEFHRDKVTPQGAGDDLDIVAEPGAGIGARGHHDEHEGAAPPDVQAFGADGRNEALELQVPVTRGGPRRSRSEDRKRARLSGGNGTGDLTSGETDGAEFARNSGGIAATQPGYTQAGVYDDTTPSGEESVMVQDDPYQVYDVYAGGDLQGGHAENAQDGNAPSHASSPEALLHHQSLEVVPSPRRDMRSQSPSAKHVRGGERALASQDGPVVGRSLNRSRTPPSGASSSGAGVSEISPVALVAPPRPMQGRTPGEEGRVPRRRLSSKTPHPYSSRLRLTLPQLASIPPQALPGPPSDPGDRHEPTDQSIAPVSFSPIIPRQAPP